MTGDEIFDALTSSDNACVKGCLEQLRDMRFGPQLLAYVLNLHLFHENAKIRALAEELFKTNAPPDLIDHVATNWQHKYRRHQQGGMRWLHPAIDAGEFMLIAQVTRRNFFARHPKTGMNPYAAAKYGVEVEELLDCYGGQLRTLPEKVTRLRHIAAVAIGVQESLDVHDIVEKLSTLPALSFLAITKSRLEKLPDNFSMLVNLERLELHFNPIAELGAHVKLPKLKLLSIGNTQIKTLDLRNFPALDTLMLEDERRLNTLKFENVTRPFLATSGPNGFKVQINPS